MNLNFTSEEVKIRVFSGNHEIIPQEPKSPVWETCLCCESKFDLNNLHPGHVKFFGNHPKLCRRCGLCFGDYNWDRE